jgi:hypothetical protein
MLRRVRLALVLWCAAAVVAFPTSSAHGFGIDAVVTGGHVADLGGGVVIATDLAGNGFSFGQIAADFGSSPTFHAFSPGATAQPSTLGGGIEAISSVQVLGVTYVGGPNVNSPFIGGNVGAFDFTTSIQLPPAAPGQFLTFTSPFTYVGGNVEVICLGSIGPGCAGNVGEQALDLHLSGHGTGLITFRGVEGAWITHDLHYDFTSGPPPDPAVSVTPEPATLLLGSTFAVGLALASYRRRQLRRVTLLLLLLVPFAIPGPVSALDILPITSASIMPLGGLAIGGTFSAAPTLSSPASWATTRATTLPRVPSGAASLEA